MEAANRVGSGESFRAWDALFVRDAAAEVRGLRFPEGASSEVVLVGERCEESAAPDLAGAEVACGRCLAPSV